MPKFNLAALRTGTIVLSGCYRVTVCHDSFSCLNCLKRLKFYENRKMKGDCSIKSEATKIESPCAEKAAKRIKRLDRLVKSPKEKIPQPLKEEKCKKGDTENAKPKVKSPRPKKLTPSKSPSCKSTPGKSSLKRRSWILNNLKGDEVYSDDIYEQKEIYSFQNVPQSEEQCKKVDVDNCKSKEKTPRLNKLTPSKSPAFKNTPGGKGTLKRRRWLLNNLKDDESYEDDIYEQKELYSFQNVSEEDDETGAWDIPTPKWAVSLSPQRRSCDTPDFSDCISLGELSFSRKEAEEFIFRRKKRRGQMKPEKEEIKPREREGSEIDVNRTLVEAEKQIREMMEKQNRDSDSDNSDSSSDM